MDKYKIADHYGKDVQLQQLIEEMAELTQAICKVFRTEGKGQILSSLRDNGNVYANLREELADVKLLLDQVIYLYDCEKQVNDIMDYKIKRTLNRIGGEQSV